MISSLLNLYLVGSIFTAVLFILDKKLAESQKRRISEKSLILSSLAFGWPGAIIAMKLVRHKTQKIKFLAVFGLVVLLNIAFACWIYSK